MGEETTTETSRAPRMGKKKLLIISVVILLVLAGLSIGTVLYKKSQTNTLPKNVKNQVSGFQPYYFSGKQQLPAGFSVDKKSIRYEVGTLFFTLTSPDGKSITVSQQPVPQEFSSEGGSFIGKESIDTKNGKATISYVQGRTSAFMITNDRKTMVILNSNQAIETGAIRSILSGLNGV